MKTCFKCGESKSLDEFYLHPKMADGRLGKCKTCTKLDSEIRRTLKQNDPQWVVSELVRHREKSKKARQEGRSPKARQETKANWIVKNPTKRQAHNAVNSALRDGKIQKSSCLICGNQKSEAHHEDYSKPLDVVWLCRAHHGELHHKKTIQRILGPLQTA